MKLAFPTAAAARWLFVPLAGAAALASACSAAPAPPPQVRIVSTSAHRAPAPVASRRAAPRARRSVARTPAPAPAGNHVNARMVVGMDPETGQLGTPTAEQMAGLSTATRGREAGASERSAPIHHADG